MTITPEAGGAVTFSDTGCYVTGSFLKEKRLGTPKYDIAHIPTPKVDGSGSINYGFRTHAMTFIVIYVADSEDAIVAAQVADSRAMANGPSTIVVSGTTFNRCFLDSFEAKTTPRPVGLGTTKCFQEIEINFTARGL